jgi:2-polyprenyl-3-methyl-5-hydroxy-6-metoxy-1,4-benzoquinol methylase
MNIKNLRKNYKTLSLIERHSLFVSAIMRKDESEENAVVSASPQMLREMPDFTHLYSKVLSKSEMTNSNKKKACIYSVKTLYFIQVKDDGRKENVYFERQNTT